MAATFTFDGQQVTVAEVAARFTCYGTTFLREALKAGCRSQRDLQAYEQSSRARRLAGNRRGAKVRLRSFDCRRRP
jgi:hypothetical protein